MQLKKYWPHTKNKKNEDEDFLSVFRRIGISAFKKDLYENPYKDKLKNNEYFFDHADDLISSKHKKIIIQDGFWKENKNILLEKKISIGVKLILIKH